MQEMYPSLVFINPNVKLHFSTMNVLKKVMTWISISFSLWLILITPAVTAWGPVPPSAPSSCTHIGVGNGDHRRCPPALVGGSSSKEATLVGGSTVYSSSKVATVTARGPVPPSAPSSCTHIGVGNGGSRQRCPPSTHRRRRRGG